MSWNAAREKLVPGPGRVWNTSPRPQYMAVRKCEESARQSDCEEHLANDAFDRADAASHVRANRRQDFVWVLLYAAVFAVAAFVGSAAANAMFRTGCRNQEILHSQAYEPSGTISVLEKSHRVPFLENVPTKPLNFTPDELLGLPATIESNEAWHALIGPSQGHIVIDHPEQYGLPPGIPHPSLEPHKGLYGLSMAHQLHCLIRIRQLFYDLVDGRLTPEDFHSLPPIELTSLVGLNHGSLHISHCFDYIQEGIRCAGQLDVEYPDPHGGGVVTGERMCKDWEHIYGILEAHAFDAIRTVL